MCSFRLLCRLCPVLHLLVHVDFHAYITNVRMSSFMSNSKRQMTIVIKVLAVLTALSVTSPQLSEHSAIR